MSDKKLRHLTFELERQISDICINHKANNRIIEELMKYYVDQPLDKTTWYLVKEPVTEMIEIANDYSTKTGEAIKGAAELICELFDEVVKKPRRINSELLEQEKVQQEESK